jgi:hypothetical protein
MKKVILMTLLIVALNACSSLSRKPVNLTDKYGIDKTAVKNWDTTMIKVVKGEALLEDWYGGEEPLFYLRKTGTMSEKDFQFLESLKTKEITDEDVEKYVSLLEKYNKKIPRKYFVKDENIKDPKGLVDFMVRESNMRMHTPSSHIAKEVATKEEWQTIIELSQQKDLSEKDVKKLRKLLNSFIKRNEFYERDAWFNREVSKRSIEINNLRADPEIGSFMMNNVNAKALYIAYPEYFSKLEKWDD